MGFGLIIAGLVFLFNPCVSVLDVLPDAIGIALLIAGSRKIGDMSDDIDIGIGYLWKVFWLSLAQIVIMFLLPGMEDKAFSLVFVFVFALFGSYLLIRYFICLFDGMQSLSTRFNGSASSTGIVNIKALTVIFLVLRGFLNLLPELQYLSTTEHEGLITSIDSYGLTDYTLLLQIINIAGTLVVGIFWLVCVVIYFRRTASDYVFISALSEHYLTAVRTDVKRYIRRDIKYITLLSGCGFGLTASVILDGVDYLPTFLGALMIFLALKLASKNFDDRRLPAARLWAIIYTPFSAAAWFYSLWFAVRFYYYSVFKHLDTTIFYLINLVLALLTAIVFIVLTIAVCRYLRTIVEHHAFENVGAEFVTLSRRHEEQMKGLRRSLVLFRIAAIICGVSNVTNTACMHLFPQYLMMNTIIHIIFIACTVRFFTELYTAVIKRYE